MIRSIFYFLKQYSTAIVSIGIVLILGVIGFREFYYWGEVEFYISTDNVVLTIEEQGEFECLSSPCLFSFPPNTYLFTAEKEGYNLYSGEFTVDVQEKIQKNIILDTSTVQIDTSNSLSPIISSDFIPSSILFPIEKGGISSSVYQAYYENNTLFSKNQRVLFTDSIPFWTSTDEIGRGVWIVNNEYISFLNWEDTQNIPVFSLSKNPITLFKPFSDSLFLYQSEKKWFLYDKLKNTQKELYIETSSSEMICMKDLNTFIFLNNSASGLELSSYDIQKEEKNILTYIENISLPDIYGIRCAKGKVIIYPKNEDNIVLSL